MAVEGLPGRGWSPRVARPSTLESRAAGAAAAARSGQRAYVVFTDRIHSVVRGETELTREEMWQQPLKSCRQVFLRQLYTGPAWCVVG